MNLILIIPSSLLALGRDLRDDQFRWDVAACVDKFYSGSDSFQKNRNRNPRESYIHQGLYYHSAQNKLRKSILIYSPAPQLAVCLFRAEDFNGTYLLSDSKKESYSTETIVNGKWVKENLGSQWYIQDPYFSSSDEASSAILKTFSNEDHPNQAVQFIITDETFVYQTNGFTDGRKIEAVSLKKASVNSDVLCVPALRSALARMTKDLNIPECEKVKKQLDP
ncbi:MAG: hypothetical protein JWQ35_2220 [Bacteriovoracaceae bacterium]|nr:hypothetical protein [Bacteriovoracaceae bacterium]